MIHEKYIQLSCYLLSDGAAFYFDVKQFAPPHTPISSLLLYHIIASVAPPSFLPLIEAYISQSTHHEANAVVG